MILGTILSLFLFAGVSYGVTFFPNGQSCGLTYGTVIPKPSWICDDNEYITPYPGTNVGTLLSNDELYWGVNEYLNVTKNCQAYVDNTQVTGQNEYYMYESVCKMNRRQVRMIWATVPGYTPTAAQAGWRDGLLPVHVLEGQHLYDAECVHPWADGMPQRRSGRGRRRNRRPNIYATGFKRHVCKIGYGYKPNLVCKPTGFIAREILVYSEHANQIFSVVVPDVPTSCACAYCDCGNKGIPGLPKRGK